MERNVVLGLTSSTCNCCGSEVTDLKDHLSRDHFCSTWNYMDLLYRGGLQRSCPDCGSPRYLLSPYYPDIYVPCKCSMEWKTPDYVLDKVKDLQKLSKTNKYYQLVLSSPGFIEKSDTHNIKDCIDVIKDSVGPKRLLKDTYLGGYFKPGYPKEVSKRNKGSLSFMTANIQVDKNLEVTMSGKTYKIIPLEKCGYDLRHHSRYSILNSLQGKSTRYTKRIKLDNNICYKFWNNKGYPETKSIFKIIDDTGEEAKLTNIDLLFIKQVILRNKVTSDILWSIYNEVLKYSSVIKDEVLLKNTTPISEKGKVIFKFTWKPEKSDEDSINISIL